MIEMIIAYIIAIASLLLCIFFLWKLSNKYIINNSKEYTKRHPKEFIGLSCIDIKINEKRGEPIEL